MVIHDETVDRTTDGTGRVNDMTLAEIKELNTTPHGDKVPTLTELLAAASDNPNQLLNLELKGSGWTADESVLELKRIIESSGVLDRAFVSPPGEGLLLKLGQMVPEVRTTWKPDATVEVTTDKAQELSVDAVMARLRQLDANVVRQLHSQNLYAWSRLNNREVVWEKLDSVGVDAVLTDRPAAFLTWCNNQ